MLLIIFESPSLSGSGYLISKNFLKAQLNMFHKAPQHTDSELAAELTLPYRFIILQQSEFSVSAKYLG